MPFLVAAGQAHHRAAGPTQSRRSRFADGDFAGIPANTIQHSVTGTTLSAARPMLHPRCTAALRRFRVERRWSGEASSVMTSAWNADWCVGLGARPRDVRVAEVVED